MNRFFACSTLAVATSLLAVPAVAQDSVVADSEAIEERTDPDADVVGLQTIVVTAQRRESSVQDTSAAISAFSGEALEESRTLSFEDLAGQATSLSFTALSPLDQEFNIRGITNPRLDSPSADQSVGIFVDDVYVGRSGLFNSICSTSTASRSSVARRACCWARTWSVVRSASTAPGRSAISAAA